MRTISKVTNSSMNPRAMTNSGTSIEATIVGLPSRSTLAGWCNVFHQSTENLMIGKLTTPTKAKTDPARPPRDGSSNPFTSAM